jgi:5'-3' exonuclease
MITDGNPLIWRSVDIYKDLRTKSGKATGAIYGALEILFRAASIVKPDHIVVAWDVGKSRWRKELYPGYKASRENRGPTTVSFEDVIPQFADVQHLLGLAGLQQFGVKGVEADDLIGLLSSGLRQEPDTEVIILSSDRDLHQLVRSNVLQFDSVNKRWTTVDSVKEDNFGLTPEQLILMKAITGDSGDDIPGVKGLGPSGAAKLLAAYGNDLEKALAEESQSDITKMGKKFASFSENRKTVELAKKLVTIPTIENCSEFLNDEELSLFKHQLTLTPSKNRFSYVGHSEALELSRAVAKADLIFKEPIDFSRLITCLK